MRNNQRLGWRDDRDQQMGIAEAEQPEVEAEAPAAELEADVPTEAALMRKSKTALADMLTKADMVQAIMAKETKTGE